MEMSPTKHRLSIGKFTSSVSNWNPSGNCSSGRKRWQKPARRTGAFEISVTPGSKKDNSSLCSPPTFLWNVYFGKFLKSIFL